MEVNVFNSKGEVSGKANLPDSFSSLKLNKHLVHEVVTAYLSNQRKGTHSTLTRTEVRGGGKKPWKQKHTGRARAGSSSSPLWRGGGIIFGPKPRSYRVDLPGAKVRAVLSQVLASKFNGGDVVVAERPDLAEVKTKKVNEWLKKLSLPQNILLVIDKKDEHLLRASRNLADFKVREWSHLHPYDVLNAGKIVLTPEAAKRL
jgi:large subunit ribosomal protein L4